MPRWGLTDEQMSCSPWGLDASLLQPAKTVTDPVHGDIYLNKLEVLFLDSPALQRLRRVRQLGTTCLVYPGATHSRLSHALGALRSAQDLIDAVVANRESPHHRADLLDSWRDDGEEIYVRRLAEATVLARLGALLHDMCHVPFGHTVEDDLGLLDAHDKNQPRFRKLWGQFPSKARLAVGLHGGALRSELQSLILSKGVANEWRSRYPFVADIVGNTICADLLDYIRRDHLYTGLPLAVGDRFAADFYVVNESHVHYGSRLAIRVTRGGKVRVDILTELLKYLRYRYELSERALYHHAKVAADAMIGKLLEMWSDAEWVAEASSRHPALVVGANTSDLDDFKAAFAAASLDVKAIDLATRQRLEHAFVTWSDDGLLEQLRERARELRAHDKRWDAIFDLADAVLGRRFYKPIGFASGPDARAVAETLYEQYQTSEARKKLERDAAHYVGLDRRFHVVMWVPSPGMKLKVADVLVDADGEVMPLSRYNRAGEEIVEAHRELWAVAAYAHPSVASNRDQSVELLSFFSQRMGVTFRERDSSEVPLPNELARRRVADKLGLTADEREALGGLAIAAKDGGDSYRELQRLVTVAAQKNRRRKPGGRRSRKI
jgi:HD superfamily phosphohydrolase